MTATPITNHGRIRRSAFLIFLALVVEALSLYWRHPLSFYVFVIAGGILGLLGVVSFLLSFVSRPAESEFSGRVDSIEDERRAAEG